MDARVGHATYDTERPTFLGAPADGAERRRFSEETARVIDERVRSIVNPAFERALTLLRSHRAALDEGARKLLAEETLVHPASVRGRLIAKTLSDHLIWPDPSGLQ